MKKQYIEPAFKPVRINMNDIIATSDTARFYYGGEGNEDDDVE